MMRVNLLKNHSNNNKVTKIDTFFEELGGTLYTNCFTPAPDTPRSLACMQSGLYPHFNGCDSRVKWPKFFLKSSINTIFDIMNNNQFKQIFYIPKHTYEIGPFNSKAYEYGSYFHDKNLFKKELDSNLKFNSNFFAHFHIQDYHWCIDDYGANKKAFIFGANHLVDFTKELLNGVDINDFDYIFIYSDHGHKFWNEHRYESNLMMLNEDRTNILMFIRKKNETNFNINKKLCSIIDMYPTISEILDFKNFDSQGISFFSKKEHPYVVIEDHSEFSVKPIQGITQWAYRDNFFFYSTNLKKDLYKKNNLSLNISHEEKNIYIKKISLFSPTIKDYGKMLEVLERYRKLKEINSIFNNGKKRIKNKLIRKIFKIFNTFSNLFLSRNID